MKTLDHTEKQDVSYCIPLWLRDEQIRASIARVKGRIQPFEGRREDPVAVVCYGPSLRNTWEQIRSFKYVVSCSGAHPFLIERGIVPQWHVAVDPLPKNTVKLIGTPHPDVDYLIASTCHPDVFDHLEGFNVKLWHVFDSAAEGVRMLPHGEWAITGGCDVGLRAITIAAFLGFRELHVFGMDHSAGTVEAPLGRRHADAHPSAACEFSACEVDGTRYLTTSAMLAAAQSVAHELDQLPAVHARFYGEGLCQALIRTHVPKVLDEPSKPFANIIGFNKPELISAEYAELNARLHRDNLAYGVGGAKHADTVRKLRDSIKAASVLDYGAGKGHLAKALDFPIWQYDPAIPEIAQSPRPADLVICTDVLEHVEPERLPFVLADLKRCVKQLGYFVIHTGPAQKTLADGRNTHLIQKSAGWWQQKLAKYFDVGKTFDITARREVIAVVAPKGSLKKKNLSPVSVVTTPAAPAPAAMEVVTGIQVMA